MLGLDASKTRLEVWNFQFGYKDDKYSALGTESLAALHIGNGTKLLFTQQDRSEDDATTTAAAAAASAVQVRQAQAAAASGTHLEHPIALKIVSPATPSEGVPVTADATWTLQQLLDYVRFR